MLVVLVVSEIRHRMSDCDQNQAMQQLVPFLTILV